MGFDRNMMEMSRGYHGDAMMCVFFLIKRGIDIQTCCKSDGEMMEIGISMGM